MSNAKVVPLTCHGHTRPVTHLSFSSLVDDDYYLISGCKDNNPMLREGVTGDWIGTFIGHKGAVWQTRLSDNAGYAVTASADFTAKLWDPHSGECLQTLSHEHMVRSVAFVPGSRPALVATGGFDKKLRIFDLENVSGAANGGSDATDESGGGAKTIPSYEIGAGIHTGSIHAIVWGIDQNMIITGAEDKTVRWWDLRTPEKPISTYELEGTLGSCELNRVSNSSNPRDALLAVAGGKTAYFFSATTPGELVLSHKISYDVASVAVNAKDKKFVVGGRTEQWVRVYDLDTCSELNVLKGHHGPVWSTSFSPDGKLCATGSEDGTIKLWKFTTEPYGLWR